MSAPENLGLVLERDDMAMTHPLKRRARVMGGVLAEQPPAFGRDIRAETEALWAGVISLSCLPSERVQPVRHRLIEMRAFLNQMIEETKP